VHPEAHNWLDNWRYRHHLPYAAGRADAVITVSRCSRADLIRHLRLAPARVHVTTEGLDGRFAPVADGPARQAVLARYGIQAALPALRGGNQRAQERRAAVGSLRPGARPPPGGHAGDRGKRQWQTRRSTRPSGAWTWARTSTSPATSTTRISPPSIARRRSSSSPRCTKALGCRPRSDGLRHARGHLQRLVVARGRRQAALLIDPYDVPGLAAAICRVLDEARAGAHPAGARPGPRRAIHLGARRAGDPGGLRTSFEF